MSVRGASGLVTAVPDPDANDNELSRTDIRAGRPSAATSAALETHILDAAWQVALTCGASFSLDQVSQQARTSKRTIYTRFHNKDEMVRRMLERRIADFLLALRTRSRGLSFAETLENHAVASIRYFLSLEGRVLGRLIDSYSEDAPDGANVRQSLHIAASNELEAFLQEAAAKSAVVIEDPNFAAHFWLECLVGHTRAAGAAQSDEMVRTWARKTAAMFVRALGG